MATLLGKLSLDDSPLGEPGVGVGGMLLKIHSGSDSPLKAFDISSVSMNFQV